MKRLRNAASACLAPSPTTPTEQWELMVLTATSSTMSVFFLAGARALFSMCNVLHKVWWLPLFFVFWGGVLSSVFSSLTCKCRRPNGRACKTLITIRLAVALPSPHHRPSVLGHPVRHSAILRHSFGGDASGRSMLLAIGTGLYTSKHVVRRVLGLHWHHCKNSSVQIFTVSSGQVTVCPSVRSEEKIS